METKINEYALQYATKTEQHIFAKKFNKEIVEYMKVNIIDFNQMKTLVITTLDKNFHVKDVRVDNSRFYFYTDLTPGMLKHQCDVYLKPHIFGYIKGEYYAIPGRMKNMRGSSEQISLSAYFDLVAEKFLKAEYIKNRILEIREKRTNVFWPQCVWNIVSESEKVEHFRICFTSSAPEILEINMKLGNE
jgi:hypothetical protein